MINFITRNLFQGDLEGATLDIHHVVPKIDVIVYLGMDCSVDLSRYFISIPVVHVPLLDSTGNSDEQIKTAINTVTNLVGHKYSKKNVLVSCMAGISRSSLICLGYLVCKGHSFDNAEKIMRKCNPRFMPEPELYAQVKNMLTKKYNYFIK